MPEPTRRLRFSLETKVMVPVLAMLVLVPALTLWLVNRRLREQIERDADFAAATARGSFVQALNVRKEALLARVRLLRGELRFQQTVRLKDRPTLQNFLQDGVLESFHDDTELALYFTDDGSLFADARRGPAGISAEELAANIAPHIAAALSGTESVGAVARHGMAYQVVAMPVKLPERRVPDAVVFGIRITDGLVRDVRPAGTEVLILAANEVIASTLPEPAQRDSVLRQLAALNASGGHETIRLAGQRYEPATGTLDLGESGQRLGYVVLSDNEARLRAFERTRALLIGVSVLGIVVSAVLVWFFVRRVTHPLVELRDSAEAVGRGDFSRRIERFSNDECGDLADAFNRMTSNLHSSRAELERAMQQLRATQEQLIQSEKLSAVGQFVAGVAHELNNPLTTVVGFSELLQSNDVDAKTRGHLERIAKSAHRCHKIVHSLLSFARQHPPERKLVNLHVALDEVLEIMAYELRTGNVSIVREFAPDLPPILADAHQLQQVFVNILGNARQAIEPVQREGRVIIRTRREGGRVRVEFEDNGPGIRPEHLARIFDPFFTTKPVGKGTGLGLSLCYGIVQEHGGKIFARSERGQGATFTIELPVAQGEGLGAAPRGLGSRAPFPVQPATQPAGGSGRSVLVIDDEQWILDLATELLQREGHVVEAVTNGERAMETLRTRHFDVILSDWKMPGLNGVRLYEHLRATDPAAARRMIFMTGDVVSDSFQAFLQQHEITCLSKPFSSGEFRAAIEQTFGRGAK